MEAPSAAAVRSKTAGTLNTFIYCALRWADFILHFLQYLSHNTANIKLLVI